MDAPERVEDRDAAHGAALAALTAEIITLRAENELLRDGERRLLGVIVWLSRRAARRRKKRPVAVVVEG